MTNPDRADEIAKDLFAKMKAIGRTYVPAIEIAKALRSYAAERLDAAAYIAEQAYIVGERLWTNTRIAEEIRILAEQERGRHEKYCQDQRILGKSISRWRSPAFSLDQERPHSFLLPASNQSDELWIL